MLIQAELFIDLSLIISKDKQSDVLLYDGEVFGKIIKGWICCLAVNQLQWGPEYQSSQYSDSRRMSECWMFGIQAMAWKPDQDWTKRSTAPFCPVQWGSEKQTYK